MSHQTSRDFEAAARITQTYYQSAKEPGLEDGAVAMRTAVAIGIQESFIAFFRQMGGTAAFNADRFRATCRGERWSGKAGE